MKRAISLIVITFPRRSVAMTRANDQPRLPSTVRHDKLIVIAVNTPETENLTSQWRLDGVLYGKNCRTEVEIAGNSAAAKLEYVRLSNEEEITAIWKRRDLASRWMNYFQQRPSIKSAEFEDAGSTPAARFDVGMSKIADIRVPVLPPPAEANTAPEVTPPGVWPRCAWWQIDFADPRQLRKMQLFVNKGELGDDAFAMFSKTPWHRRYLDLRVTFITLKMGELAIRVKEFTLLSVLRPPPKNFTVSPTSSSATVSVTWLDHERSERSLCSISTIREIRNFMDNRGFMEVETDAAIFGGRRFTTLCDVLRGPELDCLYAYVPFLFEGPCRRVWARVWDQPQFPQWVSPAAITLSLPWWRSNSLRSRSMMELIEAYHHGGDESGRHFADRSRQR